MSNKSIICFVGDEGSGKTTAAQILEKHGFHFVSITPKVEELSKMLFDEDDLKENNAEILTQMRKRGCLVHKGYWVNQVLIGVTNDNDKIVIDDLELFEIGPHLTVFQIFRPEISNKYPDIPVILNDGTIKKFEENILDAIR